MLISFKPGFQNGLQICSNHRHSKAALLLQPVEDLPTGHTGPDLLKQHKLDFGIKSKKEPSVFSKRTM